MPGTAPDRRAAAAVSPHDPRRIRALTHPVRLALLECLELHGPLTATDAAARIGETPTTCSFHLRQLAKYGFVQDAGEAGRRERPWRLVSPQVTFPRGDDPASVFAAGALESLVGAQAFQRWETWRRASAVSPDEWRKASPFLSWVVRMTPEELVELDEVLRSRLSRLAERADVPADARPVEVVAFAHPVVDDRSGADG
jgi:predicted ArsR family transcriptional regulator